MARRLRKMLQEAIADRSCRCSGQRRADAGAGDAAEYYKKYAQGVPRVIGIQLAPTLSTVACCARCAARCSFFFFCRATRRPATSWTRQTFTADRINVSAL